MSVRSTAVRKVTEIIRKICNPLVRDFHEIQRLQGYQNLSLFAQTTYDRLESRLLSELHEYNVATGSRYEIVVFPIDGRDNFFRGIPEFTISVLLKRDNEAVAGVVESLMNCTTFYTERSVGAYLEDLGGTMRLKLRNLASTTANVIALADCIEDRLSLLKYRMLGCDSLSACYVAAGRGDVLLLSTDRINPDLLLLIKLFLSESGGKEFCFEDRVLFAHLDLCERFRQLVAQRR